MAVGGLFSCEAGFESVNLTLALILVGNWVLMALKLKDFLSVAHVLLFAYRSPVGAGL